MGPKQEVEMAVLNFDNPAVQTHLSLLQQVISRMAGNCAMCKTLCATLVSTIGAVAYAAKVPSGLWIAVIPILLFWYLDAMYLSLEQGFRKTYSEFVARLHKGEVEQGDLFVIRPPDGYKKWKALLARAKTWSVGVPYTVLLVLTFLIMAFVRFSKTT